MTLLDIDNLCTYFHTEDAVVKAVDDISFAVEEGSTLGIVGESGSGKSVTSLSVMRLLANTGQIESGKIVFLGKDLVHLPEPDMRKIRGKEISMIFQEPMTSLNPVFTVGAQVMEAIRLHQKATKEEARQRTIELFREVGLPEPELRVNYYPHQMSGGQKQRVMIAMALSCNPKLLIADEPTTALDVTIQAQILDILRELRDQRGMSVLFITHDLGVIAEIADHVAVMFKGKIVEYGDVLDIFSKPQHPYTKGLLACRPRLDTKFKRLPTVADYMKTRKENGQIEVIEKTIGEEQMQKFLHDGRGRYLHPKSELAAMGHPWEEDGHASDATTVAEGEQPLLEVKNLKVYFPVRKGLLLRKVGDVKAVDDISFKVYKGQTLGLVGESGCGKTTTGRAILRLVDITEGDVFYQGEDLAKKSRRELRDLRRQMQIIFQDPYGSMNPRMTIESALIEPMSIHRIGSSRQDRRDRAVALLEEVGMAAEHLRRYPHEFSGGQRQRICIARALTVEPDFIICDESVSALDVSVQAQVLNLLNDLQTRRGLTYIFISHDLSVVKFMADMMAVMNAGKIVEFGPSETIYALPKQAYTRKLIEATPKDSLDHIRMLKERRLEARKKREHDSLKKATGSR
ncbi:ABC transporter ATP-binding protein [Lignipirellula cremea]|uniref:Glutathione import ATP-binding protein GsiA n=1 Tax=Lignipirellula cremea TaxID=2528010 RepID=A0A518E1B6_9BACT|nr:ABC transporter ATP-binding protein [Lignipirellula cremea]QDU97897.1 Glutathione import ATP-binding protein GsiA [Lignipirellula cremea]